MSRLEVTIGPGPTLLRVDGEACPLGPTETGVVAALALFHPQPLETLELCDLVWGGRPPATARSSLQNHLSRIRRRVPALIDRVPDGYRLATQVQVELAEVDDDVTSTFEPEAICAELADTEWVARRRSELWHRLRSASRSRIGQAHSADDPTTTLGHLRDAVEQDVFDERAWFQLAAVTTATLGRDAGLTVAEEATRALATSGLEPGRRLRDLERLIRDGERELTRLMTDRVGAERPPARTAVDTAAVEARATEVFDLLDGDPPTHVRICGPARSGRSALLDLIAVRASRAGVSVRTMVGVDFDGLALPVVGEWRPRRRRLLVVDDLDRLGAASRASLEQVMADAASSALSAGLPLLVVSTAASVPTMSGPADDAFVKVDIELRTTHRDDRGTVASQRAIPFAAAAPERALLDILAVSELPVRLDDLVDLVPDAEDAAHRLSRSGWIHDRHEDGHWSIVDDDLRSTVCSAFSDDDRLALHHRLATAAFAGDAPAVRSRRRARHAVAAVQLDRAAAVDALERAAQQAQTSFDHHAAACFFARAAAEAEPLEPVRSLWAGTAAGRALLAAGDVAGLDQLEAVIERSLDLGLPAPAAAATHAFCRLGPASTAGVVDARAARLVDRVTPRLSDPVDRSLVGAAATMVHVLAGDVERCRQLFDQAVDAAEESGRDDVLAEVLPFAYLSRAAPEDLDLREHLAERLAAVAERLERPDVRWEALHLRFSNQLQRADPGFRASARLLGEAADASRDMVRDWEMAYVRATVAHLDGRLTDAEDEIRSSLGLAGAVGSNRAMAVYGSVLLACRFDEDRVHELAPSIEAIAAEQPLVLAWQAPLALAAAVTGSADRAAAAFDGLVGEVDRLPRECNYTAALVMLGEAAARLGHPDRSARAIDLLTPWSGRWAWTGTCSFGPIDLTLARLAESNGDHSTARRLGTAALVSAAAMRSPLIADRAARLVLRQH